VRKVIFKSSAHFYGAEQDDPAFFLETMRRPHPPRTAIERDICEAEAAVGEFAEQHPRVCVTVLRFANGLGPDLRTSHTDLLGLPVVPTILGFDPRYQFIHEDDIAGCLEHVVRHDLDGVFNCAADGVLALSEVISLLGKGIAPVLPPWGTGLAAAVLRRLGLRIPPEMLNQMRFGRGLDNRRLKATGYRYRYTTRETVIKLREHQRLSRLRAAAQPSYRYEEEVEEFLRWSPSVRQNAGLPGGRPSPRQLAELTKVIAAIEKRGGPVNTAPASRAPVAGGYDDLRADELIALLPSLEAPALEALRAHEAAGAARRTVLAAIDRILTRQDVIR
jgi:UDP-glucose 4-epimerase